MASFKNLEKLSQLIKVSKGEIKGGTLLKNVNSVNVFSGEIYQTNVLLWEEFIAGIGDEYQDANQVIDLKGKYLFPGFIDGHIHIINKFKIRISKSFPTKQEAGSQKQDYSFHSSF